MKKQLISSLLIIVTLYSLTAQEVFKLNDNADYSSNEKYNNSKVVTVDFMKLKLAIQQHETVLFNIDDIVNQVVYFEQVNIIGANYTATTNGNQKVKLDAYSQNLIVKSAETQQQIGRLNVQQESLQGLFFINNKKYSLHKVDSPILNTNQYMFTALENHTSPVSLLCEVVVDEHLQDNTALYKSNGVAACYVIEVATEADYELYLKYGSDVNTTLQRIVDQFNLVEGIYQNSGIDLSFALVYQNVWSTVNDPYVEDERFAMRNEFRDVWNNAANGFSTIHRDVSYMVSGKTGTGGGAAFSGAGNSANAYAVGQEFSDATPVNEHLIAHEIGHTLSAGHDSGGDCLGGDNRPNDGTMCSYVGFGGFSFSSVNQISNYLNNNSSLFTVPLNTSDLIGGTITNTASYTASNQIILGRQISNSGYVKAIAGRRVMLDPGFRASNGSFFEAIINPNMNSCD